MIIQSDARHIPIASNIVQCVVTSPPYWGLRSYDTPAQIWGGAVDCKHEWEDKTKRSGGAYAAGSKKRWQHSAADFSRDDRYGHPEIPAGSICCACGAWLGSLGLEPNPELYVEHIVQVFREIRRVLRDDGTVWANWGDSYFGGKGNSGPLRPGDKQATNIGSLDTRRRDTGTLSPTRSGGYDGLKTKDLCGIPWRCAFALQADGWWLRSDIIFSKPNCMPESVKDRPTRSHEYIFLLAKSERYFYDADAIKEPASSDTHARYARGRSSDHKYADGGPGDQTIARTFEHMRLGKEGPNSRMHVNRDPSHTEEQAHRRAGVHPKAAPAGSGIKANESFSAAVKDIVETRNKRSVWTIATQPYSGAHFATFPEELVKTCILAGTSSQGCCRKCRAPLRRVLEKGFTAHDGETDSQYEAGSTANRLAKLRQAARARGEEYANTQKTIDWENTCECDSGETVPCIVLDPFVGSGTVIRVATRLQRKGVGCDLNFEYLSKQASKRMRDVQVEMQYPR